jgi:bacillolysin
LIPIGEVKRTGLVAKVISRYKWCLRKFLASLGVAFTLATGVTLLLPSVGLAQADTQRAVLRKLAADTTRPLHVRRDQSATPYLITGRIPFSRFSRASTVVGRGSDFLATYGAAFGLTDPAAELRLLSQERDSLGITHLRYEQRHRGLPVLGRELRVHLDGDAVLSVNGNVVAGIDLSVDARVSRQAARRAALASLAKLGGHRPNTDPALVVFVDGAERPHLAWHVAVPTPHPLGLWRVYVDASSGTPLFSYDDLQTARNRETHTNGNDADCNIQAAPQCTLPGSLRRNEAGCIPVLFTCPDAVVNATHANTGAVYDYYQGTHARDSYDAAGHTMRSTVHFGSDYNNAFWCGDLCAAEFGSLVDGEQMVYGDGDGLVFSPLGQALDVAAHELTHGVIDAAAGLQYFEQSGAQNESYADVFGVMVDRDDWLLGEDAYTPGTPGDALRSLADPTVFGQPAHMDDFVHTVYDNGGVHINSGIPNHAAYLTSEGPGYGIGRDDTEDIYYRALTVYVTPTADFVNNLAYLLRAAEDLFGAGSLEAGAVARAHAAVGLALPPAVIFPNGGENLAPGASETVTWSTEGAALTFAVDYLRVSPSTTYTQGFESSALLPPEFATAGDAPWTVTTTNPAAGARSARSGVIGHGQRSELSFTRTMSASGNVTFLARLNTEQNFDYLSFYVDGELKVLGSGNSGGWIPSPVVPVSAGTHAFTFVYEKDESVAPAGDSVAIDNLIIPKVESVVTAPITAATTPGATTQAWLVPSEIAGNYKVRVTALGIVPWLASDDSNGFFGVGTLPPVPPPPPPPGPMDGPIVGTAGPDVLTGTPGPDVIRGHGGNDIIRGLGGNDRIEGGGGNDRLEGGSGRDTIIGGPGKDVMSGQAGRDKLLARYAGTDRLNGGLGLDSGSWSRRDRARSIEHRLR